MLKIALRFWLFDFNYMNWFEILLYLIVVNNNVTNVTIEFIFNKIVYEFRVNNTFELLKNLLTKNYNCFWFINREFVEKIIIFVNVIRKLQYDIKYINIKFVVDDYVYLYLDSLSLHYSFCLFHYLFCWTHYFIS